MAEASLCYMLLIAFLFPLCQLGLPSPIPSPDISAWGFAQEVWGFFIEFTYSGVRDLQRLSLCTNPGNDLTMWFEPALCGQRLCQHLREPALASRVTDTEQAGLEIALRWGWRCSKLLCTGGASETRWDTSWCWVQGVVKGSRLCKVGIISLYKQLHSRGSWASFSAKNCSVRELILVSHCGN